MMQRFLLEHGWLKHGATGWVRKEWQEELDKLGKDAHLSAIWNRNESIDDAYVISKIENSIIETKQQYNNETKLLLENIILDAIKGSDWGDNRSAVKGFTKKTLYAWYLSLCDDNQNPIIDQTFNYKPKKVNRPYIEENNTEIE